MYTGVGRDWGCMRVDLCAQIAHNTHLVLFVTFGFWSLVVVGFRFFNVNLGYE